MTEKKKNFSELQAERKALLEQLRKLEEANKELRPQEVKNFHDKVIKDLEENGFTFDEVFAEELKFKPETGKKKGRKSGVVYPIKYKSGTDSWTGQGPTPQWVKDAIAAGTLDSMLVKGNDINGKPFKHSPAIVAKMEEAKKKAAKK